MSPGDSLAVTVSVDKQSFRAGSAVAVTVTVRNQGTESTAIETNPCPSPFEVMTAAGVLVGPDQPICTAQSVMQTLKPSERYVFSQTWSGTGYRVSPSGPTPLLAPGDYQLRGRAFNSHTTNPAVSIRIDP
jgi:hypothetical protein